jgi:hypothetical protein
MFALKRASLKGANRKHIGTAAAVAVLAVVGMTAMPGAAHAWWRGGMGVGIWVPPVVVAPPPPVYVAPARIYAPPPVAYYEPPPRRFWIPPHWEGPYWVAGHWR